MDFNDELYRDLFKVRKKIKNKEGTSEARVPIVCTDDALFEMARILPQRKEDFLCVDGLGATFVEKYADKFLEVILRYKENSAQQSQAISSSAHQTLKELEKKLVNINRRNRLLYMPKISNKYAYDLYDQQYKYDPFDIIFSGKEVCICDISEKSSISGQSGAEKYKRLVALLREVNKDMREKGQFDLYIGYPFVKGRLAGENFDVRTPLALFPVEVSRESNRITIRLDQSKDIIYNNNIVLAHFKFNNISQPLPSNVIEEVAKKSFISNLIAYYEETKIDIAFNEAPLSKFKDYKSGEFPKFENGELLIEENIVLGKFPTYSNALQKDFNDILQSNEINGLLANILTKVDEIDYFDDSYGGEGYKPDKDKTLTISEHDLTYIGDLNSAQENVITAIKKQNALVVQGPPGTGKSQTITSLISDSVNNQHSVLMVSEKKAALDVVYSRLGDLNRYALMIDDINNKNQFYSQVEQMLNLQSFYVDNSDQLNSVSDLIDSQIAQLEAIAEKLYSVSDFGIEVYKLYLMNRRVKLSNSDEKRRYPMIKKRIPQSLFSEKFEALDQCYRKFSKKQLVDYVKTYRKARKRASWVELMRNDLSEFEVAECQQEAKELSKAITEWNEKNFLSKILSKRQVSTSLDNFTQRYFLSFPDNQKESFLNDNFDVGAIDYYHDFAIAKPVYDSLNISERAYCKALLSIAKLLRCNSQTANDELFNFIISYYLQDFEAKNRDVLMSISNFSGIVDELTSAIAQKKKLTRQLLEDILWDSLNSILSSKRQGEIARIVESKRKWSIQKFVLKFSFELFRGIKIWLMTPEVVSELLPLETGLFDLVIFDEASQMYVEKGVPAIQRAKKVVIAGDSKQLRPSNLGAGRMEYDEDIPEDIEGTAALEEESLLDVARFKFVPPVILNYHYRSKYEELIAFSNYAFYKGKLYVSPNVSAIAPPIQVYKVDDGQWIDRSNRSEARKVIELLQNFFKSRQAGETIGIITFNIGQRDLIEDLIDEECARDQAFSTRIKNEINRKENGEDVGLFVKNIENVQGDERDVIFFSIGYAKNENGRLVRNFGWLNQKNGENRLNVAISRARQKVVIVTSFEPHELQVEDAKNDGPKYLRKYLEYAFAISNGDKANAQQVLLSFGDTGNSGNLRFDSDFENQVYDALTERGYTVESQIGIGGYSIDLAVRKDDKYLLGIECDGKLYHSSKSARERDYHRQKYLESRGWIIHRIWSTNWWKNSIKEIDKIDAILQSIM